MYVKEEGYVVEGREIPEDVWRRRRGGRYIWREGMGETMEEGTWERKKEEDGRDDIKGDKGGISGRRGKREGNDGREMVWRRSDREVEK